MASQVISNAGHDDMIHDAVLDYYGRRLATCSSDRTIKIFDVDGESHRLVDTLRGHEGAVWCVAWAHPKYGNILASSSYDGKVLIWREAPATAAAQAGGGSTGAWQKLYQVALHTASVNTVAWAPHEAGCLLACASSDGNVSVLEFKDNAWSHVVFQACGAGVNSVSWAPALPSGALTAGSTSSAPGAASAAAPPPPTVRRLVTGGCDCQVRIWEFNPDANTYACTTMLPGHTDWVRDVAWSPTVLSKSYIASASQDKTVRIWTSATGDLRDWRSTTLAIDSVAWRVSWSLASNVLAVSSADNRVSVWTERLSGGWDCVRSVDE